MSERPLLVSWLEQNEIQFRDSLDELKKLHADRPEDVLFRNPAHASAWKFLNGIRNQNHEFAENILIT